MLDPIVPCGVPNVQYTDEHIKSTYQYQNNELERDEAGKFTVRPQSQ
jgi:hypothetical protein